MRYDAYSGLEKVATQTLDSVGQIGLLCQLLWVKLIHKKAILAYFVLIQVQWGAGVSAFG